MTSTLNPFDALDTVQSDYRNYVETFQNVDDDTIATWIDDRIETGKVLWKEPFVQLNQRFKPGTSLQSFVDDGTLHPGVLDVFDDDSGTPIDPYQHQSEAIESIHDGNTIVSTGTGSGKSFAFGIPIVSHCLEARARGEDGIKAVIVYPMNALANSQYEEFASRLADSGLTLGLYTGDTPHNPDDETEFLRQFGRTEAFDCEVVSRDEMQSDPPDILMTNYVMLDYILTRHEDKQLFPDAHAGTLEYLVLDEIHTYTGQQGADVAALIRRLRTHTDAGDSLTCIGTSATVQSSEGQDADTEIAEFSERIFGAPVSPDSVVGESYLPLDLTGSEALPDDVAVTDAEIQQFDGSPDEATKLAERLTDRPLTKEETRSAAALGNVLVEHPTVAFLDTHLSEESQQIHTPEETATTETLVSKYLADYRPDATPEAARRELQAALLAGTVATTDVQGQQQPIFIPKLHSLFSQGAGLVACLTRETLSDSDPHLSEAGDINCRHCAEQHDRERRAFPLSFCRACGQEYYTVTRSREGHITPRDVSNLSVDDDAQAGYLMRGDWDRDEATLPADWFDDDGRLRDTWEDAVPQPATYCPSHNRLSDGHRENEQLDCGCFAAQGVQVMWAQAEFLFCANCGVNHTRMGRSMELSKMFIFGGVGRSTATDVLIGSTMQELPDDQEKTIAFSDNRQDTALQASHLNNLYQRVKFRRALYHSLDTDSKTSLANIGNETFDTLEAADELPSALKQSRFGVLDDEKERYSEYLQFHVLMELQQSRQRGQQSLEDVGLLDVEYEHLDLLAEADDAWEDIPALADADAEVRLEYCEAFLDLFRRTAAISHSIYTDFGDFRRNTLHNLDDETHFHKDQYFRVPEGFSDTADTSGTEQIHRLTHPRSRHVRWTMRAFDVDEDRAAEIITAVVGVLSDPQQLPILQEGSVYRGRQAYMLEPALVRLKAHDAADVSVCPKCKTVVTRGRLNMCLNSSCGNVTPEPTDLTDSYFHELYTQSFNDAVDILAAEHSGQIEGDLRKELETRFRDGEDLNTIVCTPTMELGIDIGDLANVFMRNVPPNPSNYAQRSGRAGRQNQPSLVTTFCGSGYGRASHDQYFYQRPQRIIAGEISPPTFLLNNKELLTAHINALVLEVIDFKLEGSIRDILEINPEENDYSMYADYRRDLETAIATSRDEIIAAVADAFARERTQDAYDEWFTDEFIEQRVDGFVDRLDAAFGPWRLEYARLTRELRRLNKKLEAESGEYMDKQERQAIEERLDDMRNGGKRFYSYQYLRSQGFLPNYGFPRSNCTLSFTSMEDDIQRDEAQAIREFAPGNHVYYRGQRHGVTYARPKTRDAKPVRQHSIVCPECQTIQMGEDAQEAAGCPTCGYSFAGEHTNPNTMELPDQRARPEEHITSDDEERQREGYEINKYYEQQQPDQFTLEGDGIDAAVTYEPSARIVTVNSGIRGRDADDDELEGFALCSECNRWLTSHGQIDKHVEGGCYANADREAILTGIELYTEGNHDTVTLTTQVPMYVDDDAVESFFRTLKEAIYQGILVEFDLDAQEITTFSKPAPDTPAGLTIVFHETSEGGAGALKELTNPSKQRFAGAIEEALDVIHANDTDGCERACYECLLSYYNQREHEFLDRTQVLPWLQGSRSAMLSRRQDDTGGSVLAELYEACDSQLERDVIDAIAAAGIPLPDAAQKTIYDGDEPVVQADFYYDDEHRGQPIVVFVDGPVHEKEHVEQADDRKRQRLLELGYRYLSVEDPDDVPDVLGGI